MKWNGRLKEYAGECSQKMVWWVKQAEAERRISELEALLVRVQVAMGVKRLPNELIKDIRAALQEGEG